MATSRHFLQCSRDVLNLTGNLVDLMADCLKPGAGCVDQGDPFVNAADRLIDGTDHVVDALVVAANQGGDLMSGSFRLFGQFADFLGHYGKAASLFTGSCRFDRGIERKQVGLSGDVGNQADDFADLF